MLLTISQTAQDLGLSIPTVKRRILAGNWPYYRLGARSIRLDPDEIRALGRMISEIEQKRKKAISNER